MPGNGHVVYLALPEGLDLRYALLMRDLPSPGIPASRRRNYPGVPARALAAALTEG